jgi:polyisoprenoid-binding protein YceI
MKKLVTLLALSLAPALALAAESTWNLDASHSNAGFAIRHLVVSTVRGNFTKFTGTLKLDEADVTKSTVEATLDVASVDTRVADRDAHLKSPDFFDVAKYPTMTFRSTKVVAAGKDKLAVTGDLTLHGVTRPVTLEVATSPEVKGMFGETRRAFAATGKIDRKDFGLTWSKLVEAGPVLGDEVTLTLEIEAVKDQKTASK